MKIQKMIRVFDQFLRVERNLSPKTRAAYAYDLRKFTEWMVPMVGFDPETSLITTAHLKEYLAYLQEERRHRPATLSRTISTMRAFFKHCVRQEVIEASPAEPIFNPKTPKRLPVYLVESELQKLLEAPDPEDPKAVRDYAILVTLGFTGVRLQELVNLDIEDIEFERRTIKVFGKGAKERLIPINEIVAQALITYLQCRLPGTERAVFLNRFGRRLSGRSVEYIVEKYVRRAGITKAKVSPHKLRHTFATLLHMKNVDLLEIKSLLGHSSITSTQIYTHTHSDKLRAAVNHLDGFGGKSSGPSKSRIGTS